MYILNKEIVFLQYRLVTKHNHLACVFCISPKNVQIIYRLSYNHTIYSTQKGF